MPCALSPTWRPCCVMGVCDLLEQSNMTLETTSLRDVRSPMTGGVAYLYDRGEIGGATWRDVSAEGASIRMGRYLRPGRAVVLRFPSPALPEEILEIPARIVWCRPAPGSLYFAAGLQIRREAPSAAWWQPGRMNKPETTGVGPRVWFCGRRETCEQPQPPKDALLAPAV